MVNHRARGFFTFAQNNGEVDYVRLAYGLALSLRHSQKEYGHLSIGITPGTVVDEKYAWAFDNIIEIPWGDHAENSTWKLENEWKAPWMSPYEETIKLDADMLFFSDIGRWWDMLSFGERNLVFANKVLNYRGGTITDDRYRKVFTSDNLPNIYSAFTYFRKTDDVFEFFNLAKIIYWNWETFFEKFLSMNNRPSYPSTDVIFALACKILDVDQHHYRESNLPVFTHMKTGLQGWKTEDLSEDWSEHIPLFFTPNAECKIGVHRQVYPLHYHVKTVLSDEIIGTYESILENIG